MQIYDSVIHTDVYLKIIALGILKQQPIWHGDLSVLLIPIKIPGISEVFPVVSEVFVFIQKVPSESCPRLGVGNYE